MADAQDLKSWADKTACGFESRLRHHPSCPAPQFNARGPHAPSRVVFGAPAEHLPIRWGTSLWSVFRRAGAAWRIKTIENWQLKICHLSSIECRHDVAGAFRPVVAFCRPHRQAAE